MEHEEYNRNRAVVNLRSLGQEERDQRITDEWLAEVQAGIDPDKSYHCLQRWAELAGRTSEYRTTYALLCNQMHPSFHAVDSHLLFDSDTRVRSVTVKADVQSLPLHLAFVVPVNADAQRIRAYSLSEYWMDLLDNVLVNASDSASVNAS